MSPQERKQRRAPIRVRHARRPRAKTHGLAVHIKVLRSPSLVFLVLTTFTVCVQICNIKQRTEGEQRKPRQSCCTSPGAWGCFCFPRSGSQVLATGAAAPPQRKTEEGLQNTCKLTDIPLNVQKLPLRSFILIRKKLWQGLLLTLLN